MEKWYYLFDLCKKIEDRTGIPVRVNDQPLDTSSYQNYIRQIKEIYGSSEQD